MNLTRLAIIAGPVVTLAGMAATPWEPEKTTASYLDALAENPTQAQIACLLLVFGYALLGLANFTVLRHADAAPRVLRSVTAVLCFFGATILPGMVLVDFYDLAIATELSRAQGVAVSDVAAGYGLAAIAIVPALLGFALGMVLVCVTAWKAKLAPVWVAPVLLIGIVVSFAGPPAMIAAASVLIVGAYALIARGITRGERTVAPVAVPVAA